LPVKARVTAVPAADQQPLGSFLRAASETGPSVIAIPVHSPAEPGADPLPGGGAAELDRYLPVPAADIIASGQLTGRAGEITQTVIDLGGRPGTVMFLGIGDAAPSALRRAGAALARRVPAGQAAVCTAVLTEPDESVRAFVTGLLLGSYQYTLKSTPAQQSGPEVQLLLAGRQDPAALVERAAVVAGAVALARDLGNTPSMTKSPAWLAGEAERIAAAHGLSCRVWTEADLARHQFGGLLGVGAGSARPPRLIELSYQPADPQRHVVLIGKGITFDSGGLSLKSNDGMKTMKTDMAGGAAVIATMSALAQLGAPIRVTGLVAAAENMPSGSALRVGDVIRHYGGRTVEVLNTDAEGRLVLADALAYADAELAPDVIVDLATLTGAARVALGAVLAALYATDDDLAAALLAAGTASGDRLWRMPLADDYRDGLDSPFADLANVASGTGRAGSIDAALFLREFAGGRAWAHLDIAGAARATADDGENTKGATGFGTQLLLHWLTDGAPVPAPANA
jgi:leucyl aminopeptidase